MTRFVKEDILNSASNIILIDLKKNENLLPSREIDLGFAVKKAFQNAENVKPRDELQFRLECRTAMIEFCTSLFKLAS